MTVSPRWLRAGGVPRDDSVALLAFRFACVQHDAARDQRVADINRLEEIALIDAEERSAAFGQILHAHTEHRVEHEQRIDDRARMAQRLRVRFVEIQRAERQRRRRERRVVAGRDGAAPVVLEDAALGHVFEAIALGVQLRSAAEIRFAHAAPRISFQKPSRSVFAFEIPARLYQLRGAVAAEHRIDQRVELADQLGPLRVEIGERDADVGRGFVRAIADADAHARFRACVGPRDHAHAIPQRDEFRIARQRIGIGIDAGRVAAAQRHRSGQTQAELRFEAGGAAPECCRRRSDPRSR